jgi:demethylmenaquinone methyltransferase/2-methoxy-6-polyprenyl-1,4-benzoquinol methylase
VDRPGLIDPTDKSAPRIAGMFDRIAPRYDVLNHVLSAGIDRRWRRQAIRSLQLTGREVVLDLCTGTGDLAIAAVTPRSSARRVVGIDFAGEMLRIGRTKVVRGRLADRIALARGDATRLPVASASVDAVTIGFGIRNVHDVTTACDEIVRVLRPGGRIAILEFAIPTLPVVRQAYLWYFRHVLPRIGRVLSRHDAAYSYLPASVGAFSSPKEFVTILRQAGLADVSAVPLTLGIVYLYTGCRRSSLAAGR